jgi:transcriptional regulator with XRE-family HTH domain
LHFCQTRFIGKKRDNPAYPTELNTLGDHLRKVRLDRDLSQSDIARLLNVTTDTVTGWEMNRHEPPAKLAKAIIDFLGYVPFMSAEDSLGKRLRLARLASGMTQEEVAAWIGCDESNLRLIEACQRQPQEKTKIKMEGFISSID